MNTKKELAALTNAELIARAQTAWAALDRAIKSGRGASVVADVAQIYADELERRNKARKAAR